MSLCVRESRHPVACADEGMIASSNQSNHKTHHELIVNLIYSLGKLRRTERVCESGGIPKGLADESVIFLQGEPAPS